MADSDPLALAQFPRAAAYHPDWIRAGISGGANSLWLAEWLTADMDLHSGMRVLDLGCGRGLSSVFLAREFGVQVWSTDLWFGATERRQRIDAAGVSDHVFPIHADARSLPFAAEFFDAILSIDSFLYYGTDDLYANYLAGFVKPGGQVGIAGVGLTHEFDGPVPDHLAAWWEPSLACLHTPQWWQRHWQRSRVLEVERSDAMPDGWQRWLDWQLAVSPDNHVEIDAVRADQGRHLGYVRTIAHRIPGAPLDAEITQIPVEFEQTPLLRDEGPMARPTG